MTKEKKQILILVVLAIVVLGVGAFQFVGTKPAPAVATNSETPVDEEATTVDEADPSLLVDENGVPLPTLNAAGQEIVALAPRDPFQVPSSELTANAPQVPPAPVQNISPPVTRPSNPRGNDPYIPPMSGSLPSGGSGFAGSGPVAIVESVPNYRVMGVIIGEKPMAVFEDEKGNQRLVPLGGSIDGDTTVTKIERGKVTLRHRGKDKTLVIQEEARNEN